MTEAATIYVKLLDEDVDVWRPVKAEYLDGNRYRLLDETPEDEVWPFTKGDVVLCRPRKSEDGDEILVAFERV